MTRRRPAGAAFALACTLGLAACNPEPASQPVHERAPTLWALEYRFFLSSSGTAGAAQPPLESTARGRLTLVPLDEPALFVGSLAIDLMQLCSGTQPLATLEPGEWHFLARRTSDGLVDAVWLDDGMPSEAASLSRFLLAQLQMPTIAVAQEQTPAGTLQAHYYDIEQPWLRVGLRARSALERAPQPVYGVAAFVSDDLGVVGIVSGEGTRTEIGVHEKVESVSYLVARRTSTTTLSDVAVGELREQIERLSAAPPLTLQEQGLSADEKDAMRRDAESWDSVKVRLLSAGETADAILLARAAAHLIADESLAGELLSLASHSMTSSTAVSAMFLALGDCGTRQCQAALMAALDLDDRLRSASLAAWTRVEEPAVDAVDRLLEIAATSDEVMRASVGIVVSRFSVSDPDAASVRIQRLLAALDGCSASLDGWFGLLGNAGLAIAEPILVDCIDNDMPEARRAAAVGALRRIPGDHITQSLIRLVAEDSSRAVQLAGLRALRSRGLRDADLAPFVGVHVGEWQTPELNSLLDVLESVLAPGRVTRELLVEISRCSQEEAAKRARVLLESLYK